MNRRAFLHAGCAGVGGVALGGCAPTHRAAPWSPEHGIVPVRVSWDQVIRTTVGLRPYRPAGFSVRAERLDETTVVHNYGHGGAGHSLGWGTGALAADLAGAHADRAVAVVGCGTVGLTAARQLQRRGFAVTIYAASVPPDTTSNKAFAQFTPSSGLIGAYDRTPAWDAQFRRAVETSYHELQRLVGRNYGVAWIHSYSLVNQLRASRGERASTEPVDPLMPERLRRGAVVLGPGEHPFPARYAMRRLEMRIEPHVYLDALMRDFRAGGGRVVVRRFGSPTDVVGLPERLVVNCTGLGARALFADASMTPVKGQLTLLAPQPDVSYGTFGGLPGGPPRSFAIHMMPRHDGIVLGGTSERGVWDVTPDEDEKRRIVDSHIALFDAMHRRARG